MDKASGITVADVEGVSGTEVTGVDGESTPEALTFGLETFLLAGCFFFAAAASCFSL